MYRVLSGLGYRVQVKQTADVPNTHRMQLVISSAQRAWLESQSDGLRNKSAIVRDLIDSARLGLDKPLTLVERREELPEQGRATLSEASTSSSTKKRTTKSSSLEVQPPLHAHEDLIRAFWKAKAGSKSDAGWKLLNTELLKIQDKYGDRVVREQLELAAANRWKGVSLRNYEQYGVTAKKKDDAFDWDQLTGLSI